MGATICQWLVAGVQARGRGGSAGDRKPLAPAGCFREVDDRRVIRHQRARQLAGSRDQQAVAGVALVEHLKLVSARGGTVRKLHARYAGAVEETLDPDI